MMTKVKYILFAACMMCSFSSCVDTVILPDNKTVDEDYWQQKSEVETLIATAYAQLRDATAIRNMIVWGDFRSDELTINTALPTSAAFRTALQQIYSLNVETENEFTKWYPFYSAINYCNLVLEKAEGVIANDPDYTRGDYEANKAQVLALRAFCYFYLTRVFHDIPVTPGAYFNSSADLNAPQTNPDSVLNMCISDLQEAAKYAVSGSTYGDWRDKGYLNQDGINAVLADIYLWRGSINRDAGDYQLCVDYCDKIISAKKNAYEQNGGSGNRRFRPTDEKKDYYLSPYNTMYVDLFGQNGQNADESIFELQFRLSNVANTGLDQMYYRYNNNANNSCGYLSSAKVYGVQDATGNGVWNNTVDQRMYEFVYDASNTAAEQFGVRKMVATMSAGTDNKAESNPSGNRGIGMQKNWVFYRLTDVMLMKAEALVQLYELGGKAEDDMRNEEAFNICQFINNRALSDANVSTYALKYSIYKEKMEDLVLAERARELCFEGKRWYDLMRYNYRHTATKADLTKRLTQSYVTNSEVFFNLALRKYTVPTAMKVKMRDERYLYMPINQNEVELNTNLVQNPVYKSAAKY